jgi:hypothetical protein
MGMTSRGSQNLALGLTTAAALQLDDFVRAPGFLAKPPDALQISGKAAKERKV